nr:PL7 alginate lyase [uncultured bacterium]
MWSNIINYIKGITLLIVFTFSFFSCNSDDGLLTGVNRKLTEVDKYSNNSYVPPYDDPKFHPVLDDSKLQAPDSRTACAQGNFDGFADWYFYLYQGNNNYMTFTMNGDHNRSELRQMIEWKTSTTSWKKMIGEVKLFFPSTNSLNQYTFMQIHDSDGINKPLIRLAWVRQRSGKYDHIWAYLRKDTGSTIDVIDLGPRPDGFFKAEIKVKSNILKVKINSVTMINENVSYWSNFHNYFKAGVYLQDDGSAKVQFKSLKYYYE